jgi:hypothetical protein
VTVTDRWLRGQAELTSAAVTVEPPAPPVPRRMPPLGMRGGLLPRPPEQALRELIDHARSQPFAWEITKHGILPIF